MALLLSADLLRQSNAQESGSEYYLTRTYNIYIAGAPASFAQGNALTAAGLPQVGDPHPNLPFAICSNREVLPNENTTTEVWVLVTYRWPKGIGPNQMRYEFGTSLRQITSSYAWDGSLITVSYAYLSPVKAGAGTTYHNQIDTATANTSVLRPISTVKFTFFQAGSPGNWIQAVTGKTNDNFWNVGGGDPKAIFQKGYTWLVTSVTADILIYGTKLSNSWFEVSGTLEYNPNGWLDIQYYTDYTGHIPTAIAKAQPSLPDLVQKLNIKKSVQQFNGYTVAQKYEPIDFNKWFPLNGTPPRTFE